MRARDETTSTVPQSLGLQIISSKRRTPPTPAEVTGAKSIWLSNLRRKDILNAGNLGSPLVLGFVCNYLKVGL